MSTPVVGYPFCPVCGADFDCCGCCENQFCETNWAQEPDEDCPVIFDDEWGAV